VAEAWIIDACRTPRGVGKVGKGALTDVHPQRLGATVLAAIAERNGLDTDDVDDIVWGTSAQTGTQGGDLGRMAALDAGYAITASGVTLDRFCGSGITAANIAAASVMSGCEDVVIAGGTEMMSSYKANASRNRLPFMDNGNLHLRELHPQTNQGVAADAIATLEKIDRPALDELAAESQRRAEVAIKEGRFDKSLVPVRNDDGSIALDREEYPRPGTTAESLSALAPSFAQLADMRLDDDGTTYRSMILKKFPGLDINHVHHAGNSSGVVDGAAAILMTTPEYAQSHGMKPRARVVAIANVGDDPRSCSTRPVPPHARC
jgi:acetyl-CoA C-acetyltransferase